MTRRPPQPSSSSARPIPPLSSQTFGLIQERIAHSLYFLVLQAILWNQTTGRQARPVFEVLTARYPDPAALARAELGQLTATLQPIGLHNVRARRCIELGRRWCERPPCREVRHVRKGYALSSSASTSSSLSSSASLLGDASASKAEARHGRKGRGTVSSSEGSAAAAAASVAAAHDATPGWEIAHLPGVGPYALDSYRIFHRDELRGLADDWLGNGASAGFEPEWKRVVPGDKELRAYLQWMWLKEGWIWEPLTGKKKRVKRAKG